MCAWKCQCPFAPYQAAMLAPVAQTHCNVHPTERSIRATNVLDYCRRSKANPASASQLSSWPPRRHWCRVAPGTGCVPHAQALDQHSAIPRQDAVRHIRVRGREGRPCVLPVLPGLSTVQSPFQIRAVRRLPSYRQSGCYYLTAEALRRLQRALSRSKRRAKKQQRCKATAM